MQLGRRGFCPHSSDDHPLPICPPLSSPSFHPLSLCQPLFCFSTIFLSLFHTLAVFLSNTCPAHSNLRTSMHLLLPPVPSAHRALLPAQPPAQPASALRGGLRCSALRMDTPASGLDGTLLPAPPTPPTVFQLPHPSHEETQGPENLRRLS